MLLVSMKKAVLEGWWLEEWVSGGASMARTAVARRGRIEWPVSMRGNTYSERHCQHG